MSQAITITKYRFFEVNGATYILEEVEWSLTGTGIIPLNDPRGVSIGEVRINPNTGLPQDHWIPLSIGNLGADITPLLPVYQYETKLEQDGSTGAYYEVQVPVAVITPSPPMDIYALPLYPGYVEITMEQFNIAMAG